MDVLQRLAEGGNTLVIIEHNLDVMKCADYIIDLGPEGGIRGGLVVATGTPEEVAAHPSSYTGEYLRKVQGIVAAGAERGGAGEKAAKAPAKAKAAPKAKAPAKKKTKAVAAD